MRTRAVAERMRSRSSRALLRAFLEELRRRRYSTALLDQARQVLPRFLAYARSQGVSDLRAVSEADVFGYARHLARYRTRQGRPLALATRLGHLSMLRRFFRFLFQQGWILQDPARELSLPRPDSLPGRVLSCAQARRLMGAAQRFHGRWWWPHVETRDRAILETLYGTGIRKGECVRLDVGDVDLLQGQLLVRNGKGRRDRVVPIPLRARQALDAYLRDARPAFVKEQGSSALFTSWRGGRLRPVTLGAMLKRRARAARLPGRVSPHVLRHTCATHLLQGGADVRHVQEILGHAQIDSTMRYTRVSVADLAGVVERCHPREKEWARRGRARLTI